jgi:hypothetical protein
MIIASHILCIFNIVDDEYRRKNSILRYIKQKLMGIIT